jgi:hypothetical protein
MSSMSATLPGRSPEFDQKLDQIRDEIADEVGIDRRILAEIMDRGLDMSDPNRIVLTPLSDDEVSEIVGRFMASLPA